MCQYKSAIVVQDKLSKHGVKVLLSPWTESHSELCQIFNLRDDASTQRILFARVEFSPKDITTAHQPETYVLKLDEERAPEWWTEDVREYVTNHLRSYVKGIIVTGPVALLIGGQYVLGPGASVECAHSMVINAMLDGSTVNDITGGTVNYIRGGTVNCIRGGTVNYIRGGTVNCIRGGTVNYITGGTVNCIRGGTVNYITGGTVNDIRGGTVNDIMGIPPQL